METNSPQTPIYASGSTAQRDVRIAGTVAGSIALVFIVICVVMTALPSMRSQGVAGALAVIWLIGAPLWFWYEYFYIYRAIGGGQQDSFEFFKHGQQLAAAIWAGLAASLGAFAASDFAKPVSDTYACNLLIPAPHLPANQASPAASAHLSTQDIQLICTRTAT